MTRDQLADNLRQDLQHRTYRLTGDPKAILEQTIAGHITGKLLFLNFLGNVAKKLQRHEATLESIYVLEENKKRRSKLSFKNGERIFEEIIRLRHKVFIIEAMIRNKKYQIPIKL
jgi:hypothetical protein